MTKNLTVGGKVDEIFLFVTTNEIDVDIYCRNGDKTTAKNQQLISLKIQGISALNRHLKKEKKSWSRKKGNQCLFHSPDYENNTAHHHKTDEIGILYHGQHVN
jgi:hypothetical protein